MSIVDSNDWPKKKKKKESEHRISSLENQS